MDGVWFNKFCFEYIGSQILYYFAVLTWVSIYWFSRAGPAAAGRIYYEVGEGESAKQMARFSAFVGTSIPLGISRFPGELTYLPKR